MPDYLAILDVGRCGTCGHSLAAPCGHCGESDSHVRSRTQAEARRVLRAIYRVPDGADLDAALIAAEAIPRPAHRPRRDPSAARQTKCLRLHPATIARLDAEAKRAGTGVGVVVDRLAATL